MLGVIRKNPALVSAVVVAVLNAAVSFGAQLSGDQIGSINTVVASLLAIVVHASSASKSALNELADVAPPPARKARKAAKK